MVIARFQIECNHEITLLKQRSCNIQAFILELLVMQILVYVPKINDQVLLTCIGHHLRGLQTSRQTSHSIAQFVKRNSLTEFDTTAEFCRAER